MSQHARIEELSSSDSDPSEQDPTEFLTSPLQPANPTLTSTASQTAFNPSLLSPSSVAQQLAPQFRSQHHSSPSPADASRHKSYQCIYPLYFDASRTRAQGRRVGAERAVKNPLAREIVDACQGLGLDTVFEPGKMHPKDWANPGRVKVGLRRSRVGNKHHLYNLISDHLQAHPTTASSPMRLRIAGMPPPKEPLPAPAVPRGWKMGEILPLHSPALSGGGVSENILRDMMAEMQGQGGGGGLDGIGGGLAGGMGAGSDVGNRAGGGGGPKKKKDKGKK
ncbi:MAG: signal recognition particle subunit [Heterodermia speciosa]|uniref:Signal recognition particle subunit n=1 Tax=Heterodermia speciosa TaxID=116794 RepID=A0A8H3FQT7_9LECA|nr:MAG: signal recognition particle subunit [Heterodermia speciosa]